MSISNNSSHQQELDVLYIFILSAWKYNEVIIIRIFIIVTN